MKRLNKKVRIGKFPKRVKKNPEDSGDNNLDLDPLLVSQILESYLNNPGRKEALNGDGSISDDEWLTFLALELLIRGKGVRLDTIRYVHFT